MIDIIILKLYIVYDEARETKPRCSETDEGVVGMVTTILTENGF